jgi:hypothetical protein
MEVLDKLGIAHGLRNRINGESKVILASPQGILRHQLLPNLQRIVWPDFVVTEFDPSERTASDRSLGAEKVGPFGQYRA